MPIYVNLALHGTERVTREVQNGMQRFVREKLAAMRSAENVLRSLLRGEVTAHSAEFRIGIARAVTFRKHRRPDPGHSRSRRENAAQAGRHASGSIGGRNPSSRRCDTHPGAQNALIGSTTQVPCAPTQIGTVPRRTTRPIRSAEPSWARWRRPSSPASNAASNATNATSSVPAPERKRIKRADSIELAANASRKQQNTAEW